MSDADAGALPTGWKGSRIGDLFDSWGGHTPAKANTRYWGKGMPWASSKDIKAPRLTSTTYSVTKEAVEETGLKVCPAGSVLVVVRSGILARTLPVTVTEFPVVINQDLKAFYSDQPLLNEWLALFLRVSAPELLASSRRDGTTVQSLQYPLLKNTVIPVPPEEERSRIIAAVYAAVAKQADALPHVGAAKLAVQRFRQSVLAAACSGRLTADWREARNETVSELVKALSDARRDRGIRKPASGIAESDLSDIPDSWDWVSVDALSSAVVDGVHKTPMYVADGVPFVTVRSLTAGPGVDLTSGKFISPEDHTEFTRRTHPQRGDILISKDGTIGVTRAVRTDEEFSIFVSVAMVKPLLYEMTDYLEIALQSPQVQSQMVGVGSGLMHLVLRDLKADGIPLPPLNEQHEIVKRVERLLTVADALAKRICTASKRVDRISQAVLAKAFRGELIDTASA
jgi:type I restriction enzyme S subunit